MSRPTELLLSVLLLVALTACRDQEAEPAPTSSPVTFPETTDTSVAERLEAIGAAVVSWADAATVADAHAAAETAANLVVGPNGPGFGDRDGDGSIRGEEPAGLLPGFDGIPVGIAQLSVSDCIDRDVLGTTASDENAGWDEMLAAIDSWAPDNNTMPTLDSHPMRIVGWATFTLASESLEDAHEYASHARLHVTVSQAALDC